MMVCNRVVKIFATNGGFEDGLGLLCVHFYEAAFYFDVRGSFKSVGLNSFFST